MKAVIRCPNCRKSSNIDTDALGRSMRCPHCAGELTADPGANTTAVRSERPLPEPPAPRRFFESDEMDTRPPIRQRKSNSWIVVLGLGLIGLFVVGGGLFVLSLAAIIYQRQAAQRAQIQAELAAENEYLRVEEMERQKAIADLERELAKVQVEGNDPWGPANRFDPNVIEDAALSLHHVKDIAAFHCAAFLPDGRSVLVLFPRGKLVQYSVPGFEPLREFELPNEGHLFLVDADLRLYVVAGNQPFEKSSPKDRIALGDLDVYHLTDPLASDVRTPVRLKPDASHRIGSVIEQMLLHPDGEHLFLLDTSAKKLRRFSVRRQQFLDPAPGVPEYCFAFCLTRDGKTLYAANDDRGSVVRIDLQNGQRTGEFPAWDSGADVYLTDVQATNDGMVFVNGRRNRETLVHVIDATTGNARVFIRNRNISSICLVSASRHLIAGELMASPAGVSAYAVPRPGFRTTRFAVVGRCTMDANFGARGRMYLSPGGKWLLCDIGRILRIGE